MASAVTPTNKVKQDSGVVVAAAQQKHHGPRSLLLIVLFRHVINLPWKNFILAHIPNTYMLLSLIIGVLSDRDLIGIIGSRFSNFKLSRKWVVSCTRELPKHRRQTVFL